ncbi:hypothetical protein UC8_08770 [Roseimaritima ulvae]|uniref:Uncharacterized protein n=1 Tax=Roseimaritima ulvae TaxID=980254 RepID=A0A5B9QIR3_9BACT|nr:hypothetical protein UC8_08770 [Roseimaritima ulvae]
MGSRRVQPIDDTRFSNKAGFRVLASATRHTFATHSLTQGGIDRVPLSHLMDHKDTAMV